MIRPLSIVYLCFTLFACFYTMTSFHLRLGTTGDPRAGFYPFILGLLVLLLSALLLAQSLRGKRTNEDDRKIFPKGQEAKRIVALNLVMFIYTLLLGFLGYLFCTAALIALLVWFLGSDNWRKNILISLLTAAVSYFIFAVILEIPLPQGILAF
jgi:putative tricarboxylic transport membrane protein